jgi:N-acetylglutamate synthase-like GNAT family acetyltransferase
MAGFYFQHISVHQPGGRECEGKQKVVIKVREGRIEERRKILHMVRSDASLMHHHYPKFNFFIALANDRLIGCGALDPHSPRLMELRCLTVKPGWQYNEVLDQLREACEHRALQLGCTQLLHITGDEAYFRERGYTSHFNEKCSLFRLIKGTKLSEYEHYLISLNSGNEIKIRNATDSDFPAIMDLMLRFPKQLVNDPSLMPDPTEFLVAEAQGGKLAGCVAMQFYSRKLSEFRSFAVCPEFQGLGLRLGQRLAAHAIKKAYQLQIYQLLAIASANGPESGSSAYQILKGKFRFDTSQYESFALVKVLTKS